MARQPQCRTAAARTAFTLAELLIVIVIIMLLVALLMPALNMGYKAAMRTADAALIHHISMGCEAYKATFNDYPPSAWDAGLSPTYTKPVSGHDADIAWPPPALGIAPNPNTTIANTPFLTGAAKVFSALAGFNASAGCTDPDPANWVNPCGQLTFRAVLTPTKEYPASYVPSEKGQTFIHVTSKTAEADQVTFASRFARQTPSTPTSGKETGAPILYYRANAAPTSENAADIFDYRDNYPITDPGQAKASTWLAAGDVWTHGLYAPSDGKDGNGNPYVPAPATVQHYGICRPYMKGPTAPQYPDPKLAYNANTFVLISPGPDGEYFTDDDITNFKP